MDCLRLTEDEILDISSLDLDLIGAYNPDNLSAASGASPNSQTTVSSYFDQLGYSSSQYDISSDSVENINPSFFVHDYTENQDQSIEYENELIRELDSATILAQSATVEKRYGILRQTHCLYT